jgi:hypothetical protein
MLPEVLKTPEEAACLSGAYSSATDVMTPDQTRRLLESHYLMVNDVINARGEVLR